MDPLTDTELEVLRFEAQRWRYAGLKEAAVRERWGWSTTRYFQVLNSLLDRPEALAAESMVVKPLVRLRDARRRERVRRAG